MADLTRKKGEKREPEEMKPEEMNAYKKSKNDVDELQELMKKLNMWAGIEASSTSAGDVGNASMPPTSAEKNAYSRWINGTGGQKQQRGNKKNKPKIYKNKIILGKERGIYKIPGSRKDYIKYKG